MNKRMERVLGIRQSGAAGPHQDRRQRRRRTRQNEAPEAQPGLWWQYDPANGWVNVDPPDGV